MANEISKIKLPGSTTEYTLKDSSAVANITRSGTTFTATKRDGSTFTFTQQDNNTTYTLAAGTGDDANKIVLTPSSGTANKITVPYATSAAKVGIDFTIPTSTTRYLLTFTRETASNNLYSLSDGIRYVYTPPGDNTPGTSSLYIGYANTPAVNTIGEIVLSTGYSGSYTRIQPSSNGGSTQIIPNINGTILNTGTTSFTQSLSSGTKIGTIKINNVSTDLYCQTNTNTTYTLSADTSNNKITLTPSSGSAQSITVPYATSAATATKATQDSDGNVINTTYLKLSGGWMTASINFPASTGIVSKDSASRNYCLIYDNGSNLWIGATSSTGTHHTGSTYISSGWSGSAGNATIYVSVPTLNGNTWSSQQYPVLHSNNYSSYTVPKTGGTFTGSITVTDILGIQQTAGTSGGISLYGGTGNVDNYGIAFRTTANKGKHGYVQSDWATYFTMNDNATRGWIFRRNGSGNVASISCEGHLVLNGSLTVGGNTANTSGTRLTYNTSNVSLDCSSRLRIGTSSQSAFPVVGIDVHDVRNVNFTPEALDKGANFFFSNNTMPNTNWWAGLHVKGWTGAYAAWEIVGSAHNNDSRTTPLYVRTSNLASTWGSWRKIYDTSNPPSKSDIGLGNVENKSSATIRGELTSANITNALGYTPPTSDTNNAVTQTATTTSANYELLFSATADNTTRTEGARKTDSLKYNPSTKELTLDGTMILNGYSRSTSTDPCPSLILKASNIDTDTAVTARVWGNSELNAHDKDGDRIGFINWFKDADGSIGVAFAAQNKSTGGTSYHNTLEMRVDKTGKRAYSVTDTKAFRTAINDTSITFTKSTTALSGNIGVTRKGNVCTITIGNQITTAGTYTQLGTISPKPAMTTHFLVALDGALRIMRVQSDGTVVFNNATAVSANAWLIGSCTYITAD